MTDYESRAKQYGFATRDEIQAVLLDTTTTTTPTLIMDVRTTSEIEADGRVYVSTSPHLRWVHVPDCTPEDCPSLRKTPELYWTTTTTSSPPATIMIYCKSGRRAATARNLLQQQSAYGPDSGCTILNMGGYVDIADMFPMKESNV